MVDKNRVYVPYFAKINTEDIEQFISGNKVLSRDNRKYIVGEFSIDKSLQLI